MCATHCMEVMRSRRLHCYRRCIGRYRCFLIGTAFAVRACLFHSSRHLEFIQSVTANPRLPMVSPVHHSPWLTHTRTGEAGDRRRRQSPRVNKPLELSRHVSKIAGRLSTVICGALGASVVFRLHTDAGTRAATSITTLVLSAISAVLTTFGGSVQSTALLRAVTRHAQGKILLPKLDLLHVGAHGLAASGFACAVVLHLSGLLADVFDGAWFRWVMSLNSAIALVFAVVHSGWYGGNGAERCGEKCAEKRSLLSLPGLFLYSFGGGLWRDILLWRMPAAFDLCNVVPFAIGLLLCLWLVEINGGPIQRSNSILYVGGIPSVTCVFAG